MADVTREVEEEAAVEEEWTPRTSRIGIRWKSADRPTLGEGRRGLTREEGPPLEEDKDDGGRDTEERSTTGGSPVMFGDEAETWRSSGPSVSSEEDPLDGSRDDCREEVVATARMFDLDLRGEFGGEGK